MEALGWQLQTTFAPSGNALQACVASIFARPLAEVPNFIAIPGVEYVDAIRAFASANGHTFEKVAVTAGVKAPTLAAPQRPGSRIIVRGVSPRGEFGHVVVGRVQRDGVSFVLEHDVHPGAAVPMITQPTWAGVFAAAHNAGAPPPRIFDAAAVARRLTMRACIDVVERALSALSRGDATMPVRQVTRLPIDGQLGILATMPSFDRAGGSSTTDVCACKVITVFPANSARGAGLSAHQGVVLLFAADDGRLLSVCDAHEVTALRTAAASAVATKHLARASSAAAPATLAILGTGEQALRHVEAIALVAHIGAVRVWGRDAAKAAAVATECARRFPAIAPGNVHACATAQLAVADADVVCTLTGARVTDAPVLQGAWLKEGAHVNAVGACTPNHRELDTECVVRSRLFVDTRAACLAEPGDLVCPLQEGAITAAHIIGELGDVIDGRVEGRRAGNAADITLFKSVGAAVEDLYAAERVFSGFST